jgi:hypothetical protein
MTSARVYLTIIFLYNRTAEEKWFTRFNENARENFNEMGLLSISIVVYTRKNGQVVIDL